MSVGEDWGPPQSPGNTAPASEGSAGDAPGGAGTPAADATPGSKPLGQEIPAIGQEIPGPDVGAPPLTGQPLIRRRRVLWTAALRAGSIAILTGALIALIAVTNDTSEDAEPPAAAPDEVSNLKVHDCTFDPPPGTDVECGYIRLPADRDANQPTSKVLVEFAIFHTRSRDPFPDPLVYLAGGPGQGLIPTLDNSYYPLIAPFVANRDVIVVDQRGTGESNPSLRCFEVSVVESQLVSEEETATVEEVVRRSVAAAGECRDRLDEEEYVRLDSYTTANIAADLEDLRVALGYGRWNLYGISYGTKLALTMMRDYPDSVRSAVLDSAYPLEADLYEARAANATRGLSLLLEDCADEDYCLGDELEVLEQVVNDLNESPARVPLDFGAFGPAGIPGDAEYTIDGDTFVGALHQSLYSPVLTRRIPDMIYDAEIGEFNTALQILLAGFGQDFQFSYGMHFSVQCADEVPFTSKEEVISDEKSDPVFGGFVRRSNQTVIESCSGWGAAKPDDKENQAVVSDIPTLILAGEYDPVTPPAWGRQTAENLSNSFFFEFPGIGHGVAPAHACPFGITLDFLDDPDSEPDSECIDDLGGVDFGGF